MFLEISDTKEYTQLVAQGMATPDQCAQAWEDIVQQNSKVVGSLSYSNRLGNFKTFNRLMKDYNLVKACIMLLMLRVDDQDISILKKAGYKIVTDKGQQAFEDSLTAAMNKSNNLVTRITMKHKELIAETESKEAQQRMSYEEIMANLMVAATGISIPDNLTLARYNELNKVLARKNKKK